jgi:hypothetical protein
MSDFILAGLLIFALFAPAYFFPSFLQYLEEFDKTEYPEDKKDD